MEHVEEHILELYVLGSREVEGRRTEIRTHLETCAGCRSLAEEIASFYAEANEELRDLKNAGPDEKKALIRAQRGVHRIKKQFSTPMPFVASAPMGKVRYFVYQHPIAAGGGVFAFGAAAVVALSLLLNGGPRDTNPAHVFYNIQQSRLEILNKENQKLWDFPSPGLTQSWQDEKTTGMVQALVTDLKKDGINEVLTVLPVGDEGSALRALRVFDGQEHLLFRQGFDRKFRYLNRSYSPEFGADGLVVCSLERNGPSNIFVMAGHRDRSPSFVARFDANGDPIGELWHFGRVRLPYLTDFDKNGKPEIVLIGINDTGDTAKSDSAVEFPMIAVIDPSKIIGQKKSVCAQGFDMPTSDAELYYIRLPYSDMNTALEVEGCVLNMRSHDDSSIVFTVSSSETIQQMPIQFDYIFNDDMSVREVKSTNVTDRLHTVLVQQGKIGSKMNKGYL